MARADSARLTPQAGRRFALTVGAAFLVLAGVSYWRGHRIPVVVLGALGAALLLAGVMIPGRLSPVYNAWMRVGLAISSVTTPIFMGIVYFVVLTPTGVVMRLVGRDPLRHEAVGGSYWHRRPADQRMGDMTRQF